MLLDAQPGAEGRTIQTRGEATTVSANHVGEDKAIPAAILGKAKGIAIFPGTIKPDSSIGATRSWRADAHGPRMVWRPRSSR